MDSFIRWVSEVSGGVELAIGLFHTSEAAQLLAQSDFDRGRF